MMVNLPFNYNVYTKKGKIYVVVDYKDEDGNRKKKWLKTGLAEGAKKKDVNAATEQIVTDFYNNTVFEKKVQIAEETMTAVPMANANVSIAKESSDLIKLIDFMDKWLEYKMSKVSILTHQCYRGGVRDAKAFFGNKDLYLQDVRPLDVQEYYNSIIKRGCKNSTLKNRHLCLHNVFEYAVKLDLIPYNPTSRVELPKAEKHEATFYSKSELDELFKAFRDDRMELVVHIAAYYGLRRSEIIGLQWDSINFEQKTISIRRKVITYMDEEGHSKTVCEENLKTQATRRTLPLIPHIEKMLLKKKESQEHFKKLLRGGYCKEYLNYICTDDFGVLIKPEYVTTHFKKVVDKNGLRHLRFHDLRHTCASLLLANHIPLKSIQDWLGHANFETTANIYSHLDFSSRVESADKIASVLGEAESSFYEPKQIPKKEKRGRKPKKSDSSESASA